MTCQKKKMSNKGAQLQSQAPCSSPGRIWHLTHVPLPLTILIQGNRHIGDNQ